MTTEARNNDLAQRFAEFPHDVLPTRKFVSVLPGMENAGRQEDNTYEYGAWFGRTLVNGQEAVIGVTYAPLQFALSTRNVTEIWKVEEDNCGALKVSRRSGAFSSPLIPDQYDVQYSLYGPGNLSGNTSRLIFCSAEDLNFDFCSDCVLRNGDYSDISASSAPDFWKGTFHASEKLERYPVRSEADLAQSRFVENAHTGLTVMRQLREGIRGAETIATEDAFRLLPEVAFTLLGSSHLRKLRAESLGVPNQGV